MSEQPTNIAASVVPEYQPQAADVIPDLHSSATLQQISVLFAKHFYPELSVQEWIEKAQWEKPESLDPIPGTERFANRWPKRLNAIGRTYHSFCNTVRLLTSLGYKSEEHEVIESKQNTQVQKFYNSYLNSKRNSSRVNTRINSHCHPMAQPYES